MKFGLSKIGIIGLGRFGLTWLKLFSQSINSERYKIFVYDPFVKKIDLQEVKGIGEYSVTAKSQSEIQLIKQEELSACEIVFFCVPTSQFKHALESYIPYLNSEAIICDTCSVKEYPIECMKELVPLPQAIVGLHPLFGPDSVDNVLHRKVVVCRERISNDKYIALCDLLSTTASLSLIEMSAKQHDTQAVYSQGLTHLVGRALKKLDLQQGEVTTKGYEALLEIIDQTCKDSQSLFFDLQNHNKGSREMWQKFQGALTQTIEEITYADSNSSD